MNLAESLKKESNKTTTENGMKAFVSTKSKCVDFFASAGAMRQLPGNDVVKMFVEAYKEDKETALKLALWLRDIRGGSGERKAFRSILKWLNANDPQLLIESNYLYSTVEVGRWDDLYVSDNALVQKKISAMLMSVLQSDNPGLAAKWTDRQKNEASWLRKLLELNPKDYRKMLVEKSNTIEQLMSSKKWGEINYQQVPSQAMSRLSKAFARNDNERFAQYKLALQKGEAKVNASAIYPYDIVREIKRDHNNSIHQSQWNALPNYLENDKFNIIVLADQSGSMYSGNPVSGDVYPGDVCASLAIYLAQRIKGHFNNMFVSFSTSPDLVQLTGDLYQDYMTVKRKDALNTNFEAVFDMLLKHAVKHKVKAEDMPTHILTISDMQFNQCGDLSAVKMIKQKYKNAGYEMPVLVFWNVAYKGNQPAKQDKEGVILISGFSPAIMKSVLSLDPEKVTPYNMMMEAIKDPRYTW